MSESFAESTGEISVDPLATAAEPQADTEVAAEPEVAHEADAVLLAAVETARSALSEITPLETIGEAYGHEIHDAHVLTHFFVSKLPGYPGWRWAATLARVDVDSPVTVLEVEMLPGEGAVVAPEWVPWSERLATYRETQARHATEEAFAAEAAAAELSDEDDVDPEDDLLENDYSDFDVDLHGVELEDEDLDDDEIDDEIDDEATDELDEDFDDEIGEVETDGEEK